MEEHKAGHRERVKEREIPASYRAPENHGKIFCPTDGQFVDNF